MKKLKCPVCSGEFEQGYTSNMGRSVRHIWIEGTPEVGTFGGLNTKAKKMYSLSASRCQDCGFVAQFANTEWKPGK